MDPDKYDLIRTQPVHLGALSNSDFTFSSHEGYLVLLVYKANHDRSKTDFASFPHSLWGVVESASNLTPRGLATSFSSSGEEEMTVQSIESFFLSQRHDKHSKFRFMLFVWNGK